MTTTDVRRRPRWAARRGQLRWRDHKIDRATSSNPARWDGRLGLRHEAYMTGIESHGNTYWWRTCFETPGSNSRILCGSWFHP